MIDNLSFKLRPDDKKQGIHDLITGIGIAGEKFTAPAEFYSFILVISAPIAFNLLSML